MCQIGIKIGFCYVEYLSNKHGDNTMTIRGENTIIYKALHRELTIE
jgi:hypothetical protein